MKCDKCGADAAKNMDACEECGAPLAGKAKHKAKKRVLSKRAHGRSDRQTSGRHRGHNGARATAR